VQIQVREAFKINVAQYESVDVEVLVSATHHDLGYSDEDLRELDCEAHDSMVKALHNMVDNELRAELLSRLPRADQMSVTDDNLAARALAILSPARKSK